MANVRESKFLLWGGFAAYLILSAVSAMSMAYFNAGVTLARNGADLYLFGFDAYRVLAFVDQYIIVVFLIFVEFMDNNPGKNNKKEFQADVSFMASGLMLSWAVYSLVYVVRFLSLSGTGGAVAVQFHEPIKQAFVFFPCAFILNKSVRSVITLAFDKSNPKPAPAAKPNNGGGNGGGGGNKPANGGGNGGNSGGGTSATNAPSST